MASKRLTPLLLSHATRLSHRHTLRLLPPISLRSAPSPAQYYLHPPSSRARTLSTTPPSSPAPSSKTYTFKDVRHSPFTPSSSPSPPISNSPNHKINQAPTHLLTPHTDPIPILNPAPLNPPNRRPRTLGTSLHRPHPHRRLHAPRLQPRRHLPQPCGFRREIRVSETRLIIIVIIVVIIIFGIIIFVISGYG